MEGFLEANRIVEVSLNKLNCIHKSGDLPLRRTLLISKVLNTAQEVATSAHLSFIRSPPSTQTRSSKLLASISQDSEHLSSDESRLPAGPTRSVRTPWRQTSPIASAALARQEPSQVTEEEPMDFMNVSSVLSTVLSDNETMTSQPKESLARSLLSSDTKKNTKRSKPFENVTNSETWSTWQFDLNNDLMNSWHDESTRTHQGHGDPASCPKSPAKRNHKAAFPPTDKENSFPWNQVWPEEPKRFKPSTPEGCPLESLPGFCGYLSPRNLQSAPLITYMFGSAFTQPSSFQNGWPQTDSDCDQSENHLTFSHSTSSPILAY